MARPSSASAAAIVPEPSASTRFIIRCVDDAHRFVAGAHFQLSDAGLLGQIDEFLYFSQIQVLKPRYLLAWGEHRFSLAGGASARAPAQLSAAASARSTASIAALSA